MGTAIIALLCIILSFIIGGVVGYDIKVDELKDRQQNKNKKT